MTNASTFPVVPTISFNQAKLCIQSGDLLFGSGSTLFARLIKEGTNSIWSHIGMLLQLNDVNINRVMMMESVESIGVRSVPLEHYVNNYNGTGKGYGGKIMVARYNNFPMDNISPIIAKSIDLLGDSYSSDDILKIATRISLFSVSKIKLIGDVHDSNVYICSEYVAACYKEGGIDIPYNVAGYIAPSDFALCKDITPLFYIDNGA